MKSQSIKFNGIYFASYSTLVSKKEKEGPIGKYFNYVINDYYYGCETFEKALIKMSKNVIKRAINQSDFSKDEIDIAIGGDLTNQIFTTTAAIKEYYFPYVGLYAACASGILSIIMGSIFIDCLNMNNALCYSCSHLCVSEKQFRYPNEYGMQKKETSTQTVTGAGAVILSKYKSKIKITNATIGKIVDVCSKNVNDMGTIMAFAAKDTMLTHLENFNTKIDDYDLILTGDLGITGSDVFIKELLKNKIDIKSKHQDGGVIIYSKKQKTLSGGSGSGCIMSVLLSYVSEKMENKELNKVLVIATGSLHSQVSVWQKETIPAIAHAITLERENI